MLEVWERRVAGIYKDDLAPEQRELAERFNDDFTRVFKGASKADRRVMLNMLSTLRKIRSRDKASFLKCGLSIGITAGKMRGEVPATGCTSIEG